MEYAKEPNGWETSFSGEEVYPLLHSWQMWLKRQSWEELRVKAKAKSVALLMEQKHTNISFE